MMPPVSGSARKTATCPQCGHRITWEQDDCFVSCDSCKISHFLDIQGLVPVFSFQPAVDIDQARERLLTHLKKRGIDDAVDIRNQEAVYVPFWRDPEQKRSLTGANNILRGTLVLQQSGEPPAYDHENRDYRVEILPVNTGPAQWRDLHLVLLPYFRILLLYQGRTYTFLVNAMDGTIAIDPLRVVQAQRVRPALPLFIVIICGFAGINYFFNDIELSILVNTAWFMLSFWAADHVTGWQKTS